jgi:hypothetical protein
MAPAASGGLWLLNCPDRGQRKGVVAGIENRKCWWAELSHPESGVLYAN